MFHQLFIFFNSTFIIICINKFLPAENQNIFNFPNSFEDSRVQFALPIGLYISQIFTELLWKSGSQQLAALQKNWEMGQPIGRKDDNSKDILHVLPDFKRVLQIKLLVFSG